MTAVKHEWRKHEKELYCPKQQAVRLRCRAHEVPRAGGALEADRAYGAV